MGCDPGVIALGFAAGCCLCIALAMLVSGATVWAEADQASSGFCTPIVHSTYPRCEGDNFGDSYIRYMAAFSTEGPVNASAGGFTEICHVAKQVSSLSACRAQKAAWIVGLATGVYLSFDCAYDLGEERDGIPECTTNRDFYRTLGISLTIASIICLIGVSIGIYFAFKALSESDSSDAAEAQPTGDPYATTNAYPDAYPASTEPVQGVPVLQLGEPPAAQPYGGYGYGEQAPPYSGEVQGQPRPSGPPFGNEVHGPQYGQAPVAQPIYN
eukprot:Hpha_TRINITY_DN26391_c0_g1::TRINITY_DN26391_c0_g1_i1::g.9399::m.9399